MVIWRHPFIFFYIPTHHLFTPQGCRSKSVVATQYDIGSKTEALDIAWIVGTLTHAYASSPLSISVSDPDTNLIRAQCASLLVSRDSYQLTVGLIWLLFAWIFANIFDTLFSHGGVSEARSTADIDGVIRIILGYNRFKATYWYEEYVDVCIDVLDTILYKVLRGFSKYCITDNSSIYVYISIPARLLSWLTMEHQNNPSIQINGN